MPHAWNSTSFVPTVSFQEVAQVTAEDRKQSLADIENMTARRKSEAPGTKDAEGLSEKS